VLGRLDPWAALLLGVLLALGVIILLATPGPWHKVVGPAPPVKLAPPAPGDVAVFALGGANGTCTSVVWLHVDGARPSLTAVVLAPETQGFVAGAGYAPLRRIVDQVGPGAAAKALGQALGTPMDAWITLDQQAMKLALEPRASGSRGRGALLQYARAQPAWEGRGSARSVWTMQYQALGSTLARLSFERVNVVSFSNYVLGWGHVQSDLNLQGATSLATTFSGLLPTDVDVRAAAVILETCRGGEAWRIDSAAVEELRRALTFGLAPPPTGTHVTRWPRQPRVLVVLPGPHYRSGVYLDEVRRRLRRSAGAPVAVRAVEAPRWSGLVARTSAALKAWRPLAVLVAPPSDASGAAAGEAAVALRRLGERLRATGQPAVLSAPLPIETTATAASGQDAIGEAIRTSGQPISPLAAPSDASPSGHGTQGRAAKLKAAARANVATLVRACWPGALAPRLASTRLGFSFAARRRTTVGVASASSEATDAAMALLPAWGFQTTVVSPSDWTPPHGGSSVYYREGMRRAALTLAGDLGLPASAVTLDEDAPAALTLSLPE
jgi:hypothetical protein